MKKILFLLAMSFTLATGAFAQSADNTKAGTEPLLQQNEVLKTEATAFNTAYSHVQASATMSRSGAVKAQQDFLTECDTYLVVLNKTLASSTDVNMNAALNREIAMVNELKAAN